MSDRLFDTVFVRPPADSYTNCVSSNPDKASIDVELAKRQHRNYVSTLKAAGIEVKELEPLENFPDSVFMQDPAILGSEHSIVGRFAAETRRGEERVLLEELGRLSHQFGQSSHIGPPGTLEGGDMMVTDHGIFVGESTRTNREGIDQLLTGLGKNSVTPVKTKLFHLLCACSYLRNRTMMIVPDLLSPEHFLGFDFINVPQEESYACNALYVGEGKVVMPSGFPKTRLRLNQAGFKAIEVDVSEFRKGDGGVTCLSSPIYNVL